MGVKACRAHRPRRRAFAFTAAARKLQQLAGTRPATLTRPATVRPTEDLPCPGPPVGASHFIFDGALNKLTCDPGH